MVSSLSVAERIVRRLRLVRWLALIDVALLVALVTASWSGAREIVHILGPLHGGNFLLLLVVIGTAAADGLWGWWFFAAVLLTGGPIGAFIGEWRIRQRLVAESVALRSHEQELAQ